MMVKVPLGAKPGQLLQMQTPDGHLGRLGRLGPPWGGVLQQGSNRL
jgi:hypothetical protein